MHPPHSRIPHSLHGLGDLQLAIDAQPQTSHGVPGFAIGSICPAEDCIVMSEQLAGTVSAAGEPLWLAVPSKCAPGAAGIGTCIMALAAPEAPFPPPSPSNLGITTLAALAAPLMPFRT